MKGLNWNKNMVMKYKTLKQPWEPQGNKEYGTVPGFDRLSFNLQEASVNVIEH